MTKKNGNTQLVALRDLKRGGKVAFKAGDTVPEKAFPDYQRDALLATGGLRRELVNAGPPKENAKAAEPEQEIPAEVAGTYESPHDQPVKAKKAKKGKAS